MNKIYPNYHDNMSTILNDIESMKIGDQLTILDSVDFDTSCIGVLQRRDIEDLGASGQIRQLIKDKLIGGFHNGLIYKSKLAKVSYNLVCMYMQDGSVVIHYPPRAIMAVGLTRVERFLRSKDLKTAPVYKLLAEGKFSKTVTAIGSKYLMPSNCVAIDYLHMYERYDKGVYIGNQLYGLFPQYV